MARRLFTFLSALSLLMAAAVTLLWARSNPGDLVSALGPHGWELISHDGHLSWWRYDGLPFAKPLQYRRAGDSLRYDAPAGFTYRGEGSTGRRRLGVALNRGWTTYAAPAGPPLTATWRRTSVQDWAVVALACPLPAAWLATAAVRRRRRTDLPNPSPL